MASPYATQEIDNVDLFKLRFESAEGTLCERIAKALGEDIDDEDNEKKDEKNEK